MGVEANRKLAGDNWPEEAIETYGVLLLGAESALRATNYAAAAGLFGEAAAALNWKEEASSDEG